MQPLQKLNKLLCNNNVLEAQIVEALVGTQLSSQQIHDKIACKYKLRTVRYHLKKMVIEGRVKRGLKLSNMREVIYALNKEVT